MSKKNIRLTILTILIICGGGIKTHYIVEQSKFESDIEQMKKDELLNFEPKSIVEHKSIRSGENVIHYYISGNQDKQAILFLHPAFSDHTCFYKQVDSFSQEFRVITIDLIGHGLSEVKDSKQKIDKSVKHIQEIMRIEDIDNLHLVGVSMGSLIAQYFALQNSDKTLSLTCLGGYNINHIDKEVAKSQRKEMFGWMTRVVFSMNAFRRYAGSVSVINRVEQIKFYKSAQGFSRKSFSIMSSLGKLIEERSTPNRTYPLLILTGEEDNSLAKRMAKSWHTEEPQSKFYCIEKAGHCANMDNPEVFNKIVYNTIISICLNLRL
jgi:pimeloyl-ACP methyl ester carboxylesterase